MSIFALVISRRSTDLTFPYISTEAVAPQGDISVEVCCQGRTPRLAVLLRLVGGLGGRRRRRHARRRLHRGGRSGGCPEVPIRAARGYGWRGLGPDLRGQ